MASGLALSVMGITAAAGVCLCCIGACRKKKADTPVVAQKHFALLDGRISIDVENVAPLRSVGGSVKVAHPKLKEAILIIRSAKHRYEAVSVVCTHRGGEISFDKKKKRLVCGNYGHSVFRLTGQVVRGPANRPLKTYRTLIFGGKLEIFT
jgi:nitrite reductase/ring-hydroxylating ferredoxin subunit